MGLASESDHARPRNMSTAFYHHLYWPLVQYIVLLVGHDGLCPNLHGAATIQSC